MSMLFVVASYSSIFTWMGDSVPDGAGGVTLREMLSHMLKPFFSPSLSSSLTSSAASGSKEDRRLAGSGGVPGSAATRSATAVFPLWAASAPKIICKTATNAMELVVHIRY